jgi:hypothetical protein
MNRYGKTRGERIADATCAAILSVALVYFVGLVAHAWWVGRFAEVAR